MAKRKIPVFHNDHTINKALTDIENGLTLSAVANKYGVHYSTAYTWKRKHKKQTVLTDTKTNTVNGELVKAIVEPISNITIELDKESFARLEEVAKNEVRTLEQQVKYLVLEGMTRRNSIPF